MIITKWWRATTKIFLPFWNGQYCTNPHGTSSTTKPIN